MKTPYVNKLNTLRTLHTSRRLHKHSNTSPAFTIVELLIVIVVIAILAAISITAYTNFQQRAKNTAIINAASQSLKMIQAYIVEHGTYPLGPPTREACITTDTGCYSAVKSIGANSTFDTNMATAGQLPRSVPRSSRDDSYGIYYQYWSGAIAGPAYMVYFLEGINQKCGVSGVLNGGINDFSTIGYTSGNSNGTGMTQCIVKVDGPPHS